MAEWAMLWVKKESEVCAADADKRDCAMSGDCDERSEVDWSSVVESEQRIVRVAFEHQNGLRRWLNSENRTLNSSASSVYR